jgi:hypothetical protein
MRKDMMYIGKNKEKERIIRNIIRNVYKGAFLKETSVSIFVYYSDYGRTLKGEASWRTATTIG